MSPCDRVEAEHQACDNSENRSGQRCLNPAGFQRQMLSEMIKEISTGFIFLAVAMPNTKIAQIFLWIHSFRILSWQKQNIQVLSSRERKAFILELEPAASYSSFTNKGAQTYNKTPRTPNLYINTSYQVALKSKFVVDFFFKVLWRQPIPCELTEEQPSLKVPGESS